MTKKRFWISVLAVWAVVWATDFLFHGIWLAPLYQQTSQFWRPGQEIQSMMPWMWAGQLIFSWAFVWIYSKGVSHDNQWAQAFRYAIAILLVSHVPGQLVMWATTPYPAELIWKWFFISAVQAMVCAFVMTWTFQPAKWAQTAK
ncbi:MAG: hypothetical protein JWQ35_193 [Bacteriovoracaceae bacterium]|nr:hypothetical protein [Bacteriovoracaceae bacterium]